MILNSKLEVSQRNCNKCCYNNKDKEYNEKDAIDCVNILGMRPRIPKSWCNIEIITFF